MRSKKIISTTYFLVLFSFFSFKSSADELFPSPSPQDTSYFGKYIQRTMKLLSTSTYSKRNTVKILVYGQSISEQSWSDTVKAHLLKKYPSVNLIMINRAIGGYSSQLLKSPTYLDVPSFYPDLVIFHVYGSHYALDSIMHTIRRTTTAEVLFQNSHLTPGDSLPDSWEESQYSYTHVPTIATRYGLEYANIRDPWKKYVKDNNKKATELTSDGTHLNDQGNFLMAKLVERYLFDNPKYIADTFGMVKSYKIGTDVFWENGLINLSITGNKIDLIADEPIGTMDSAIIKIDNRKPSDFKETRMHYRPNVSYNQEWKIPTPWGFGGPLRISNGANLLDEEWTITINGKTAVGSQYKIDFSVAGTKTGFDGSGSFTTSNDGHQGNTFISNSKRVIIRPVDWWYYFDQNHYYVGKKFTWQVLKFFQDSYLPPLTINPALESVQTIAQGIENTSHILVISATGLGNVPLKEIRVYQPYYDRIGPLSVPKLVVNTLKGFCFQSTFDITNQYHDVNSVSGLITYWNDSLATNKLINPTIAGIPGKYWIKKTLNGEGNFYDIKSIELKLMDCTPQLQITSPSTVCSPLTVDITNSYIDLLDIAGTVDFFKDANASSVLDHPEAISVSGTYYISKSNDSGAVSDKYPILVEIQNCSTSSLVEEEACQLIVYPNPTSGKVNIEAKFSGKMEITDIVGNQIFKSSLELNESKTIDLSNNSKGIYLVRFTSSNYAVVKKLILE